MLNDDVLPVNTAATAKGTNCDVTAAAGMMSSVTQKCGISCTHHCTTLCSDHADAAAEVEASAQNV